MKFKQLTAYLGMALILALMMGCAAKVADKSADQKAKPTFKRYAHTVDSTFVKQIVDGKLKGYIFDARPYKKKYFKGHVPGAVSLPTSQFDKLAGKLLPKDKGALLVFYCGGMHCPLSHKNAFMAEKLGYTNIKVDDHGYPGWKKHYGPGVYGPLPDLKFKQFPKHVNVAFVKEVVDGKKLGLIVDSRPRQKKYNKGHVPGAINIPFSHFDKMSGLLPADKNTLVIFYCGGWKCPLSHKSAFKAKAMGYTNVAVEPAGYPAWKKAYGAGAAGPATAKPAAVKKAGSLKQGKEEGSVDVPFLKKVLKDKPGSVMLVDVRDKSEFDAGSIKGSVNISVDQLDKNPNIIKGDKPVVFICATGARAGEAYYLIKDKRPKLTDVYYIDGEVTFHKDGSFTVKKPK